ncbi:MAG: hypothetical protein E7509_00550 [Ruminococcus sp.]|nr:hypothetical protein [Ruminococcus sp.]
MEIRTNAHKKRLLKIWLWLVFGAIVVTVFVCVVMLLNHGNQGAVLYPFGILLIICSVVFFPYTIFLTKCLELLSTQKVFYSEKHLLFYFSRRDGGPEGFGEQHFYDRKSVVTKTRKNKLFISVKGTFQTKTEGFPTLEIQNPDDETSKLTFDEQVGLLYFEDSYIKNKTIRILRVFDKEDEELLLELLSKTEENEEIIEEISDETPTETTEVSDEVEDVTEEAVEAVVEE